MGFGGGRFSTPGGGVLSDAAFRALYQTNSGLFGDGRHGRADLDGTLTVPWATLSGSTYTLIEDCYCTYLKVRSGITLKTASSVGAWRVRANVQIYIEATGKISANGNNASGQTAGAAFGNGGTMGASGVTNGAGGAGGAIDTVGTAAASTMTIATPSIGNEQTGGVGGAGAVRAGGGAAGVSTISATRSMGGAFTALGGSYEGQAGYAFEQGGAGGGGGGGAPTSFVGGGGGAGGGVLYISAPSIVNLNPDGITADGGDGAAGAGAGAGGGAPGGGGVVRYWGTLAAGSYLPHAYSGNGGAPGDSTAFPGKGARPGRVFYMGPVPFPSYNVDLTSAECTAAITDGVLEVSGSALIDSEPGTHNATFSSSLGGGGFWLWRGTTAGGVVDGLLYDGTNNKLSLVVRGVVELSTAVLGGNPAAPTFQNWMPGDTLHYRFWFDPAGGSKSMGIRFSVNGAIGVDTTGTGSGAALAAITAAQAIGTSSGTWACTASFMANTRTTDVVGRVCVLGDSLSAPRLRRRSLAAWLGKLGVVGPIVSIAQGGDQMGGAGGQLADWQASISRGSATPAHIVVGPMGWNDIITGSQTAVQMAARRQALSDEFAAQNAAAETWMFTNNPAHGHVSEAQQAIWAADRDNTKGTGANPVTGIDHIIDTHVAKIGDSNFVLKMRGDNSDNLHQDDVAMGIMAADIVAAGLT